MAESTLLNNVDILKLQRDIAEKISGVGGISRECLNGTRLGYPYTWKSRFVKRLDILVDPEGVDKFIILWILNDPDHGIMSFRTPNKDIMGSGWRRAKSFSEKVRKIAKCLSEEIEISSLSGCQRTVDCLLREIVLLRKKYQDYIESSMVETLNLVLMYIKLKYIGIPPDTYGFKIAREGDTVRIYAPNGSIVMGFCKILGYDSVETALSVVEGLWHFGECKTLKGKWIRDFEKPVSSLDSKSSSPEWRSVQINAAPDMISIYEELQKEHTDVTRVESKIMSGKIKIPDDIKSSWIDSQKHCCEIIKESFYLAAMESIISSIDEAIEDDIPF